MKIRNIIIGWLLLVSVVYAAVPTSMSQLGVTDGANSPPGTEVVGANLDNYIRATAMILRRESAKGANIASAATLVPTDDGNYFDITGSVTITGINTQWPGRMIFLRFTGSPLLTHNATTLILPTGANIQTAAGDMLCAVNESGANWRVLWFVPGSVQRYRLIDVQTFTSSGTWNKPAGTLLVTTRGLGGGGGGGGSASTATSEVSVGTGAASGALAEEVITSGIGATETITVGSGGTGVSGANGNNGGNSSFGSHWTAAGGPAGTLGVATSVANHIYVDGPSGSVSTGATINGSGAHGGNSFHLTIGGTTAMAFGGFGGSSPYGDGGKPKSSDGAGVDGTGRGSGGGGSLNTAGFGARAGGNGTAGFVQVEAYGL